MVVRIVNRWMIGACGAQGYISMYVLWNHTKMRIGGGSMKVGCRRQDGKMT